MLLGSLDACLLRILLTAEIVKVKIPGQGVIRAG